jgi:hypothetical protein
MTLLALFVNEKSRKNLQTKTFLDKLNVKNEELLRVKH